MRILLFLMLAFNVAAVDATWNFLYFTGTSNGVRRVEITPVSFGVNGNNLITGDRIRYTNDGSGSLTISNMATNLNYKVEFYGNFATTVFTNYFPVGTTGLVNAASYITASSTAGGLAGFTIGQANSRFALKSNAVFVGTEPTLNGVSFTTLYGGTNGGGSGTTYSNFSASLAPGVISGGQVGTNLVGYVTNGQDNIDVLTLSAGGNVLNIFDGTFQGGWVFPGTHSGNGASLTNIGTNAMSQAAHEAYIGGGGGSSSSNTNGEWAIVGVGFDGGQNGWPPNYVDERGFLLMSGNGHNFRVSSVPQIIGVGGHLRDASVLAVSNFYACAYTTNRATNASVRFAISLSTNLAQWTHHSTVSPALSGETLTLAACPEARVWGPTLYDDGTNIHCFVAVTTNLLTTRFDLRKMTTTRSAFPSGWSTATNLGNATAYTNLIEIAPIVDGAFTYAFVTGPLTIGAANTMRLMRFGDGTLTNLVLVDAAPVAAWGNSVEGITAVRLWNNKIRLYWVLYASLDYGVGGDGHYTRYSDTDSLGALSWTDPRQVEFGGRYIQNFKPFVAKTTPQIAHATLAIESAGNRGVLRLTSKHGDAPPTGIYYNTKRSLNRGTNDFVHLQMGDDTWPLAGWFFGTNDVLKGYVAKFDANANANEVHDHGVTNWISVASNNIAFHLPVNGGTITNLNGANIQAGTINSNKLDAATWAAAVAGGAGGTTYSNGTQSAGEIVGSTIGTNVTQLRVLQIEPRPDYVSPAGAYGQIAGTYWAAQSMTDTGSAAYQINNNVMEGMRTNITTIYFWTTNACSINPHLQLIFGGPTGVSSNYLVHTATTVTNNGVAGMLSISYTNGVASAWSNNVGTVRFYFNAIRPTQTIWILGGQSVFLP